MICPNCATSLIVCPCRVSQVNGHIAIIRRDGDVHMLRDMAPKPPPPEVAKRWHFRRRAVTIMRGGDANMRGEQPQSPAC